MVTFVLQWIKRSNARMEDQTKSSLDIYQLGAGRCWLLTVQRRGFYLHHIIYIYIFDWGTHLSYIYIYIFHYTLYAGIIFCSLHEHFLIIRIGWRIGRRGEWGSYVDVRLNNSVLFLWASKSRCSTWASRYSVGTPYRYRDWAYTWTLYSYS